MNFLFLYTLGFTGPEEPNITSGICVNISECICRCLPASALLFKTSGWFICCRSSIYREQHHLHSTSPTPKPPPSLPTQLSALAPTTVAKHAPESWHAAPALPVTAVPTAIPGLPYALVTCLRGPSAAKPQSPAGGGQGAGTLLPPLLCPYCALHTGGLGDVPLSPRAAPHHASPHGSGSVTLDGTARKEKAAPVTLPSNQEEDAADSQVGKQHEEPDARGKGIQEREVARFAALEGKQKGV